MNGRRKFLKGVLAGGMALGLSPAVKAEAKADPSPGIPRGYARQSTIFCQIGNPQLLSDINLLAQKLKCDIWLGEPFSPDILAVPYFVAIIDRNTLYPAQWEEHLQLRLELNDTTPFILVDDLDWETDNYMVKLDPRNRAETYAITELIRFAHKAAQAHTKP